MSKITNKKIRWILRHCAEIGDFSTIEAAQIYGITTGRVERFWLEYDRHGWRFETIDEFAERYHRIHGGLWLKMGENPEEAFLGKTRNRPCWPICGTNRTKK